MRETHHNMSEVTEAEAENGEEAEVAKEKAKTEW